MDVHALSRFLHLPKEGLNVDFRTAFKVDFNPSWFARRKLLNVIATDPFDEKLAAEAIRAYAECCPDGCAAYLISDESLETLRNWQSQYCQQYQN